MRRFFFFQAEDGIRAATVTGVQTCALPIWCRSPRGRPPRLPWPHRAASRPGRRSEYEPRRSPDRSGACPGSPPAASRRCARPALSLCRTLTGLVDDLGVHHVVVGVGAGRAGTGTAGTEAARTARTARTAGRRRVRLRLRVHRATDLLRDLGDLLVRRLDRVGVGAAQAGPQLAHGLLELGLLLG